MALSKKILLITGIWVAVIQFCQGMPTNFTSDFESQCSVRVIQNGVQVKNFISKRTGIRIVLANPDGPLVHASLSVATEPEGHYGIAHALEHLIFSGSEGYPYRDVLSLMSSKAMSLGFIANTNDENTIYQINTAGPDGILNLLPVALDHLLYPLLPDSAFTTEVYHVTESGELGGVVYSEGTGSRYLSEKLDSLLFSALYPLPSNYAYRAGGELDTITHNLTNEKVRTYHKVFYRPENIQITVAGKMDEETLLAVVHEYEEILLSKGPRPPFTRPWHSPIPPINQSVRMNHFYPSSDEEKGKVVIGFKGHPEYDENVALGILLDFLTDSSASTLKKDFEPIVPLMYATETGYIEEAFVLWFKSVKQERMNEIEDLLESSLQNILKEEFPLSSIREYIEQKIRESLYQFENQPTRPLMNPIYKFGLYGSTCEYLDKRLNFLVVYESLLHKNTSYWLGLIRDSILMKPKAILTARPSIEEAVKKRREEAERTEKRRQELGPEGLLRKGEELEEAKRLNEVPPPPSLVDDLPVASVNGVTFHPLESYSNIQSVNNHSVTFNSNSSYFDLPNLSFKLTLDDVNSNFIFLSATMDTSTLDSSQRHYLPLLADLIFESDVLVNGTTLMSHSDVTQVLPRVFIKKSVSIGVEEGSNLFHCNILCNYFVLVVRMDIGKYETGLQWLHDILYHSQFRVSRVKTAAYNLLGMTNSYKSIYPSQHILNSVFFRSDSNQNIVSFVRQQMFLTDLSQKLENEEESQEVIKELQLILATLTDTSSISFHMATNLSKLANTSDVKESWRRFENRTNTTNLNLHVLPNTEFRRESIPCKTEKNRTISTSTLKTTLNSNNSKIVHFTEEENCSATAYVINSTSEASSNTKITANSNLRDEDMPKLQVLFWYFMDSSGSLFKAVRDEGFAYGAKFDPRPNQRRLTLEITRATQPAAAYEAVINLLNGYMNGSKDWNAAQLEKAKTSALSYTIYTESRLSDAVWQSLTSYYSNKIPIKDFIQLISDVTVDDIKKVFLKYFIPLSSPENSVTVFVCPSNDVQKVESTLIRMGHRVKIVNDILTLQFD